MKHRMRKKKQHIFDSRSEIWKARISWMDWMWVSLACIVRRVFKGHWEYLELPAEYVVVPQDLLCIKALTCSRDRP